MAYRYGDNYKQQWTNTDDPAAAARIEQIIASNPSIQAALRAWQQATAAQDRDLSPAERRAAAHDPNSQMGGQSAAADAAQAALYTALRDAGITELPRNYTFDPGSGKLLYQPGQSGLSTALEIGSYFAGAAGGALAAGHGWEGFGAGGAGPSTAVAPAATSGATPAGAFGPMAGGYAGATTSAAAPSALAATGSAAATTAPAWANPALWRTGVGLGEHALGTYLDSRGRQQAAETLAAASERAAQYSQQATQNAINYALAQQQGSQAHWTGPGLYLPGSAVPYYGTGPMINNPSMMMGGPRFGGGPAARTPMDPNAPAGMPGQADPNAYGAYGAFLPGDQPGPNFQNAPVVNGGGGGANYADWQRANPPTAAQTAAFNQRWGAPGGGGSAPAGAAPTGLSPQRQWIREQFLSPQNKNPQREPTETDYQYWEALLNRPGMDPAYLQQRMFDPEGQGSNAGHFGGAPSGGMPPQMSAPSFLQMMGGMPQMQGYAPPPQMSYQAPPNFLQMMTAQRPAYVPFQPYQMGQRM